MTPHLDLLAARSDLRQRRATFIQAARDLAKSLRPRVLIADDNLVYARLIAQALAARGIDADLARDEGAVRMALARARYDLVVVDGVRPEPNGQPPVPALYVSGLGPDARIDVSKDAGVEAIAAEVARRL